MNNKRSSRSSSSIAKKYKEFVDLRKKLESQLFISNRTEAPYCTKTLNEVLVFPQRVMSHVENGKWWISFRLKVVVGSFKCIDIFCMLLKSCPFFAGKSTFIRLNEWRTFKAVKLWKNHNLHLVKLRIYGASWKSKVAKSLLWQIFFLHSESVFFTNLVH